MLLDLILLTIGLGLIAKGGDLFVDSSVNIGRALRVPRFVIGGTLVSLATTTPELVVSAIASSRGDAGIAFGNAIGSCICNIGLVVGLVSLIMPVSVSPQEFANRAVWMSAGGVLVTVFSWDRTLDRPFGVVLLLLTLMYLYWDYRLIRSTRAMRDRAPVATEDDDSVARSILLFTLGAGMIIVGSRFLVTSGQSLAAVLGVPSAVIGFSVVAIGTSLPELVTGIVSARKGIPDLSLGNIVGANVLNLLLIVGVSSTIRPLSLEPFTQWYGFPWLGIFFAGLILLIRRHGVVGHSAGSGLLALYGLYLAGLIILPMLGIG